MKSQIFVILAYSLLGLLYPVESECQTYDERVIFEMSCELGATGIMETITLTRSLKVHPLSNEYFLNFNFEEIPIYIQEKLFLGNFYIQKHDLLIRNKNSMRYRIVFIGNKEKAIRELRYRIAKHFLECEEESFIEMVKHYILN